MIPDDRLRCGAAMPAEPLQGGTLAVDACSPPRPHWLARTDAYLRR